MSILIFIIVLGLLIFVHEFGHFIAARLQGVRVEEFGFGFPPRIFGIRKEKKTKKLKFIFGRRKEPREEETIYSLNWIPIGGFVRIYGEQGEGRGERASFASRPVSARTIIISAGVIMNFLLGMALFSLGYSFGLPSAVTDENRAFIRDPGVQIVYVAEGTPAAKSQMSPGTFILAAKPLGAENWQQFEEVEEVQEFVDRYRGQKIVLKLKYGKEEFEKTIVPRQTHPEDEGPLGVGLEKVGLLRYPLPKAIYHGIEDTVYFTGAITKALYLMLKNLIVKGELVAEVAGPVRIAHFTGQMAQLGISYLIQFVALLSINLGIINFLPFPALDGGRFVFLGIEKIKGSPVSQKVENYVHMVGFALLILLMLIVTARDIMRIL